MLARACPLVLVSAVAHAQSFKLDTVPGNPPAIVIRFDADAAHVEADLAHGKVVHLEHGSVTAGEPVRFELPGAGAYAGKLRVNFGVKPIVYDIKFSIPNAAAPVLKIGYSHDRADLDGHTLEFTLSRPAAHADLKVIGDDGSELATASADYHGERAGSWLKIQWTPEHEGNVLALELHASSTDGARGGVRLVPWSVRVPHEEVVFETGKWDIRPSEEAKLDASYKKIVDEVDRARKVLPSLPARLFIAGHTDTVGASADNRKLSVQRARAIAAWFRDRGLPLPIAYAGFGEDAPRVKTPDETDEPRNRRADYIVGFEEPSVARGVHATWMKLQ